MRIENLIRNYDRLLKSERKECPPATHDAIMEHYAFLVANYATLVDGERVRLIGLAQAMGRWFAYLSELGPGRDEEQENQYTALGAALVGRYKWLKAHAPKAGPDIQIEFKTLDAAYTARWLQLNKTPALFAQETIEYKALGELLGRESHTTRWTGIEDYLGLTPQIELA